MKITPVLPVLLDDPNSPVLLDVPNSPVLDDPPVLLDEPLPLDVLEVSGVIVVVDGSIPLELDPGVAVVGMVGSGWDVVVVDAPLDEPSSVPEPVTAGSQAARAIPTMSSPCRFMPGVQYQAGPRQSFLVVVKSGWVGANVVVRKNKVLVAGNFGSMGLQIAFVLAVVLLGFLIRISPPRAR
jgi:hypothetical protein